MSREQNKQGRVNRRRLFNSLKHYAKWIRNKYSSAEVKEKMSHEENELMA
jgi:hypothetical protein